MSILTDLSAALAAVDAARKTLAEPLPLSEVAYLEREEALYSALGTYHKLITEDTIAALVAVARAAWVLADNIDTYCPCCDSHLEIVTEPLFDDATKVYAALAPLVKEADDE